jgi:aminoglycoside phosphotransferase (APT) family kinase protein
MDKLSDNLLSVTEDIRRRFPVEPSMDWAMKRKIHLRSGPPYKPQNAEALKKRLEAFLKDRITSQFSISDFKALSGGIGNEQFSFELTLHDDDGRKRIERMVLRTRAPHSVAESHRLREFQLINAVQGSIPAPKGLWVDAEGDFFDHPTLIASFCEGVVRPPDDGLTRIRMGYGSKYRDLIAPHFIKHLATLANFDWQSADLSAFEAPSEGTTDAVIKHINWWERAWYEDRIEANPLLTVIAQWLRSNAPKVDKVSIVHGDYRSGNFLFSPNTGEITAILDWELSYLGDRHADLAFAILPSSAEQDENGRTLIAGLCTRDEFLHEYERLTGLPVDHDRLRYYDVFMRWRNAIIICAAGARGLIDQKTHNNIIMAWFVGSISATSNGDLYNAFSEYLPK